MAKIYANENFPLPVVKKLRELKHDVLTTTESGKSGQAIPDDEVLEFAYQEDRVLITFNRKHFIKLHNDGAKHAGIIVCTVDTDFVSLAQRIHVVLQPDADMDGRLIRVNRPTSQDNDG